MFILLWFAPFIIRLFFKLTEGWSVLERKKDGATQFFDRSLFVSFSLYENIQ